MLIPLQVICTNKYNGFIRPRVFAVPPNTTVEDLGNSLREIEGEEYRDKLCKLQEHYWNKLCELEGQEYRNVFRELEKLKRLNKPTDANFLMVVGQSHGLRDTDLLVTLDEHRSADGYLHLEYLDSILDRLCDTNLPGIAEVLASEVLASDRWLPALPEESEPEESEPED